MDGQDEVINNRQQQEQQQELHSSQTIIKGKRTKRQRPQSPIPFRMINAPYNDDDNDNDNDNHHSTTKSDEGSDICSNNQENNNNNNNNNNSSVNNVVVDMVAPNVGIIMSTGVSDDEDCHHTTVATASTEEEEDMANCLILLAQGQPYNPPQKRPVSVVEDQQQDHVAGNNYNLPTKFTSRKFMDAPKSSGGGYYVYECKTCSKTFPSFQALGGHRASHKKPKIKEDDKFERIRNSYASIGNLKNNNNNNNINNINNNNMVLSSDEELDPPFKNNKIPSSPSLSLQLTNRAIYSSSNQHSKPRVHECSICGAEFASGQALGGHMRRHRNPAPGAVATPGGGVGGVSLAVEPPAGPPSADHLKLSLDLDLNLPAPSEDNAVVDQNQRESKFVFASKQPQPQTQNQTQQQQQQQPSPPQQNQQQQQKQKQQQQLVFSSAALVDCHY